jgi:signal transduction histidine kinase
MPLVSPWRGAPFRTALAMVLAGLLTLGVFAGSEWTYQRALESLTNLGGRDNARTALRTVMRRLLDMETAQRGYLLTGRAQYLAPYRDAETDIAHAFRRLREHYRNDPESLRLVDDLHERVQQKTSEVAETIVLFHSGSHETWKELLLTDIGREKMESVRRVADVLLLTEERRVARERAAIYRTLEIGRMGVHGLALLSLLAYVFFLRKNAALQATQLEHARHLQAERDSLEQQVRQRTEELALLNLGLQEMREGERSGLARALHDELGAMLTTAKLDLARLRRALPATSADVAQRLQHLSSTLDEGIDMKRRMMEELMPPALENLGLNAAIEHLASEFHRRTGVRVELDLQSANVSAATGQALFSVVQIALSNVERHADATQVTLRMASEAGEGVQLAVTDNGRGFSGQSGSASTRGLKNLRHRIESLNGTFAVHSAPGEGTRIEARMPANPPDGTAHAPRATTPP